jgi:hypothetical protein
MDVDIMSLTVMNNRIKCGNLLHGICILTAGLRAPTKEQSARCVCGCIDLKR